MKWLARAAIYLGVVGVFFGVQIVVRGSWWLVIAQIAVCSLLLYRWAVLDRQEREGRRAALFVFDDDEPDA